MIIILEGENKCGKTTLANHLVEKHGFNYVKCSQPKGDPYVEYMEILKNISGDTVIDRFLYGETVYGPIYRGKSMIDDHKMRNIELKTMTMNACLIYCHDKAENIAKRFDAEKEEFAVKTKIRKALKLYEKTINKAILPVVFHQMMTPHDLYKTKKIDKLVKRMKDMEREKYISVIGNTFNPGYIFVGEKRNDRQSYKQVGQPFDFGPSSRFLFEKLKKAKVDLRKCAFVNADSHEMASFIVFRAKKTTRIIALGKKADETLNIIGLKHDKLNHPQFENRFQRGKNIFLKELKNIIKK